MEFMDQKAAHGGMEVTVRTQSAGPGRTGPPPEMVTQGRHPSCRLYRTLALKDIFEVT